MRKLARAMPLIFITILLLTLPAVAQTPSPAIFLPLITRGGASCHPPAPTGAIVINHDTIALNKIPERYLTAAKTLTVAYAHTSHGSQILTGLQYLQTQDARLAVTIQGTSQGLGLPDAPATLRFYDGNNVPGDDYITPELFWDGAQGQAYTRSTLQSGLFRLSGWTWCGQQSSNSTSTVERYLAALESFEQDFPAVRQIYFTGHTDGGDNPTLLRNNQQVRAYAQSNGKVLFDFADFEQYDPSGKFYADASDACPWCADYCSAHPDQCANFDEMGDCAHSHKLQCKLKAQGFWWMAARLSGWDGVSE